MNNNLKLGGAALGGVLATLLAGGIAMASIHHPMGPIGDADLDNNGEITRAEWVQQANKAFDELDTNKDGKIVVGEIPAPPHPGRGHGPHHPGPGMDDDWGPDAGPAMAPPAAPPANATAAAPATPAPQQAK